MEGLFSRRAFTGFGPNGLDSLSEPAEMHQVRDRRASGLRQQVRLECPRQPGVYGMVGVRGELIYVGKAKCLRSRLLSYFRTRSRDPKAGRILQHTRSLAWEFAPSEFAALLRELELIRRWQPRFNVHGQPRRRRRSYVCLGRHPAPYVFLAPRLVGNALACFGPVPAGEKARGAVRRLNDWYGLRDCSQKQAMAFTDQKELFPVLRAAGCLRYEIGTCLGPCAGACSQAAYLERVRAVQTFLAAKDTAPLETLEREMTLASAALEFERAAALRDKLDVLRWLRNHLERLRLAREQHSFVYPVGRADGGELWYLIHHGRVLAATPAPHDETSRQAAAALLEAIYPRKQVPADFTTPDEIDGLLLVAAWFRKHPEERAQALAPAQALAHL